jgi:hypothetical protein
MTDRSLLVPLLTVLVNFWGYASLQLQQRPEGLQIAVE